jgi:hypothetical protein
LGDYLGVKCGIIAPQCVVFISGTKALSGAGRPRVAVEEHPHDFGGRARVAKQVALHLYAAKRLQRLKLLLRFDTLRG